ncbi:unnamed protein product [Diamesa serratosioi]
MKLLIMFLIVYTTTLDGILAETFELKCNELKKIAYYDYYTGTKCSFSDIEGDSTSSFIFRAANAHDYSKTIFEVDISKSKIHDLPRELFRSITTLKKVQANACGIEELSRYIFEYADALTELRLRENRLKKISSGVFMSAKALQTLDLTGNKIEEIEKNAFSKLINLEYLTLSENKIKTLTEDTFKELVKLTSLRLDSNKIQMIEENFFDNNLELTEIRLDTNEIIMIVNKAFDKLLKLKTLNLASNRLHKINVQNTNIEKLLLPYNKLTHIDLNKNMKSFYAPYNNLKSINFNGNTNLLEIKVRQNNFTNISNFSSLLNLEILDLSYNLLDKLEVSTFARMTNLIKINLEYTNITSNSLTYGTFGHNINLTNLDLSYNSLQHIDINIFNALSQLTHLKIDGNNLTEIPVESLKVTFPKLLLISIVDNDWNCTYLSNMIKQLKQLNVIVYVFSKMKVFDVPNVAGIRCHNNKTDHVYWKKPVLHKDDSDIDDPLNSSAPREAVVINDNELNNNLTNLWTAISELKKSQQDIKQKLNNVVDLTNVVPSIKQALVDDRSGSGYNIDLVLQSQFGYIKVILSLMCVVMFAYVTFTIIKYFKINASQNQFYYPSDGFRRSTATIQTTMEHVM